MPARLVGYDHETGFGLVRAEQPLDLTLIPLGVSAEVQPSQPLMVVSNVGELNAAGVYVVDRRDFAGYWEYLLEDAIFTAPPHGEFGGAALLDRDGRLVGIGSLLVHDAGFKDRPIPGNMFVPIDQLKPIMGDLLSRGRRADPGRPWLGVILEEQHGRVFVTRVSPESPAASAGIAPDDVILGIDGVQVHGLMDFYRALGARSGRRRGAARCAPRDGGAPGGDQVRRPLPLPAPQSDLLNEVHPMRTPGCRSSRAFCPPYPRRPRRSAVSPTTGRATKSWSRPSRTRKSRA